MQWMSRLFTKARPTQRSLFRSIDNILKVIFSLNRRLCDRTLFSLLNFFKWRNILFLQIGPQAEILALNVPACGPLGRRVAPERPAATRSRCGRPGVARCQNQGTQTGCQHLVAISHAISHIPPVGTMHCFFWVFLVCPISYPYTLSRFVMGFSHTQTDPERKLWVFSDDGYVFTIR